jgi:glycine dehydrogenase
LKTLTQLADFAAAAERGLKAIAVIDPLLLAPGGLKAPCDFGENGADIIVGEAHHLALAPNFGGPGLGHFWCSFQQ